jgi:hypothetical protein
MWSARLKRRALRRTLIEIGVWGDALLSESRANRYVYSPWKAILLFGLCAVGGAQQPIAFPHNTHAKIGLACTDCHIGADTRDAAGLPSVRKCMFCHAKIATNKPEVRKVIGYAQENVEIPWKRVYGFSTDAHVEFRHAPHYRAGVRCTTCHGDMTQATVAEPTVTHNMGTCLTCHRQKHASEDCVACHY